MTRNMENYWCLPHEKDKRLKYIYVELILNNIYIFKFSWRKKRKAANGHPCLSRLCNSGCAAAGHGAGGCSARGRRWPVSYCTNKCQPLHQPPPVPCSTTRHYPSLLPPSTHTMVPITKMRVAMKLFTCCHGCPDARAGPRHQRHPALPSTQRARRVCHCRV